MKNKIALILPYFGTFPNYFNLWMHTAQKNQEFDFLIFTDNEIQCVCTNIKVYNMDFDIFAGYFKSLFDFKNRLKNPYKLCDYKPTYGFALKDYLEKYDYWGYCDPDIIFGKLSNFITDDILSANKRIYTRGHMTIYRNTDDVNTLFYYKHNYDDCFSYRYVYSTDFVCAYDEWGTKYGYGLSEILKRENYDNYDSVDYADVFPQYFDFVLDDSQRSKIDYFEYKDGCIWGWNNGEKREYAYVHLQKRNMVQDSGLNTEHFYIYPNAFCSESKINPNYTVLRKEFKEKYIKAKTKTKIKKVLGGALMHLLNRKVKRINRR